MKTMTKFHSKSLSFGLSLCAVAIVQFVALPAPTIAAAAAAAKSTFYKNHRMGEQLPALQQQADSQSLNYTTSGTTSTDSTKELATPSPDIVIDSIEDELGGATRISGASPTSPGGAGNRHRYEQQPSSSSSSTQLGQGQQQQQQQQHEQQIDEQPVKLEARNQMDGFNSEQQSSLQQQDPIIIDHRPTGGMIEYSSTQSPPISSTFAPPTTTTMAYSLQPSQSQQSSMITASSQLVPQWSQQSPSKQAPSQQYYYQAPAQSNSNQQQQYSGSLMSSSNQLTTTVQHPTSINSIINEQQQQQQQPAGQAHLTTSTVNGQPASLVYVNQPQAAATSANGMALLPLQQGQPGQIVGVVQNGRRVSISNWLRGIGSMLANIFNRRDHGASALQQAMLASNQNGIIVQAPPQMQQQQQQLQTGALTSSPLSTSGSNSWIQLGPNAPHWLTQAQSAIQQLQQGSNRFTTFIQSPQQAAASSLSALTVAPQQQVPATNNYQQATGDLQASGSSNSYVSIQSPSGVNLATNQPYQSGPIIVNTQQQQQQQQQHQSSRQQPAASQVQAQVGSAPQATQQLDQANKQQQQTPANGQQQNQARFSRSSSSTSGMTAKQQASGAQMQQQVANGNLPLTHYSQYSTSSSSE